MLSLQAMVNRFKWHRRQKAIITCVGKIDDKGKPQDWEFDCYDAIPALEIPEVGEILYGGYTVDELRKIASENTES